MRRWKISGLRDVIFDGPTAWLVVGQCRTTKLIKFDPNYDRAIDIRKWAWRSDGTDYRADVIPLGPSGQPTRFLAGSGHCGDGTQKYVVVSKNGKGLREGEKIEASDIKVGGRWLSLTQAPTVVVNGDTALLADRHLSYDFTVTGLSAPFRMTHRAPMDSRSEDATNLDWPFRVWCGGKVTAMAHVQQFNWYRVQATMHGVGLGPSFVGLDGQVHEATADRCIMDVQGDRRLERDRVIFGIGSKLYLDDQCFKFTKTVHDARFSPDGATAFVWGARELVQFDLD